MTVHLFSHNPGSQNNRHIYPGNEETEIFCLTLDQESAEPHLPEQVHGGLTGMQEHDSWVEMDGKRHDQKAGELWEQPW